MSDTTIKSRIIARMLDIAQPLLTAAVPVRKIARVRTLFLLEPVKPAIHLVIGDEHVVQEDERGYWMEFLAMWKIIVDDSRDAYGLSDTLVGFFQAQMESDQQLSGLANRIKYAGELPFTEEALTAVGGAVVPYNVEYRRMRGDPTISY